MSLQKPAETWRISSQPLTPWGSEASCLYYRNGNEMHITNSRQRLGRRLKLIIGLLMLVSLTAACTGNSDGTSGDAAELPRTAAPGEPMSTEKIAHLNVGINLQDPQLDPTKGGLYGNSLSAETLLRIDENGELQPWLATSWSKVSDTVYEYTLREGVKFWDGTEMTSADVKYAWDRLRVPGTRRAGDVATIQAIETPDKYTVRVELKQPDASWQWVPSQWFTVVYSKDFAEQAGDKFGQPDTLIVATGPWKIDSLNVSRGMELSAFDDYWGGEPPIERITVKPFADETSMALALRADEIDITPTVLRPDSFDATAGGGTVTSTPTCSTALLSLPTQLAPWDDVHVRRAVAHAVNREGIVAATQGRADTALETLISPLLLKPLGTADEVEAALDGVPSYEYDLNKAEEELSQSSVPNGFKSTLTVISGNSAIAEVIADQLAKIGIDLTIQPLDDNVFYSKFLEPDLGPVFAETLACSPDSSWDDIWLLTDDAGGPAGINIAAYSDPALKQLMADGIAQQDPSKRLAIYADILTHLAENLPYVPLYAENATYASKKYSIAGWDSFWPNFPWALNLVPK